MNPQAKIVPGFQPIMPTFQGLVTEEQLLQLIAYVRSLSQQAAARRQERRDPDARRRCRLHRTHMETLSYLNDGHGLKSWLLTKDHKRIALLYLVSITVFFVLGGFFAMFIRLELLTPAGDLLTAETYNKMFTMHGVVMVFFFLIPSIPAVLGNFLIPIMIGAKDLAFPRINLLSWYIYVLGGAVHVRRGAERRRRHRLDVLHALQHGGGELARDHWPALGIFITGFSSILTGLNFIVTIHRMRAPGMTWFRLPLFVWAHYATSLIMILGTPVIAITVLLVGGRARAAHRHLRSGARRRPGALPAPVLVLLAPGGLHHDPAGDGRDQRDRRRRSRARTSSATRSSRSRRWRSRSSASWSGATTCSWPASRSTPG